MASRALLRARRDRHQMTSRAVKKPRRERRLRPRRGGGVLPTRRFWRFSQNQPPTGFAGPTKTAGFLIQRNTWQHRGGSIDVKQSLQGVVTIRWKDLYLSDFAPTGLLVQSVGLGVFWSSCVVAINTQGGQPSHLEPWTQSFSLLSYSLAQAK